VTKALRYEAEMVVALAKGGNDIDQPPFSPMNSTQFRSSPPFCQKQIPSSWFAGQTPFTSIAFPNDWY
jgi:hypothetical protein